MGVSPIIAHLAQEGRIQMTYAMDDEVVAACALLLKKEGIIPALESSHALAGAFKDAANLPKESRIVINLSGRGDKDIFNVAKAMNDATFPEFLEDYLADYNTDNQGEA